MSKQRRGMLIKNTNDRSVEIRMSTRTLHLNPGEEKFITADEVRDPNLRDKLQVRGVAIVRPASETEEEALWEELHGSRSN
jgi:hypothetical protein